MYLNPGIPRDSDGARLSLRPRFPSPRLPKSSEICSLTTTSNARKRVPSSRCALTAQPVSPLPCYPSSLKRIRAKHCRIGPPCRRYARRLPPIECLGPGPQGLRKVQRKLPAPHVRVPESERLRPIDQKPIRFRGDPAEGVRKHD